MSGIICFLTTTLILLLLLLNKAYKSTLQRLFLYLTIMTLVLEVFLSVQIEHHFLYNGQEEFCAALGFLSQLATSVTFTFTDEIIIYLLVLVYYRLKGKQHPLSESSCISRSLEWILVSIAVFFPLTYLWAPFLEENYGINSAVCWIKSVGKDCEKVGLKEQILVSTIGYVLSAVSVIATVVLTVMYCKMSYRYRELRSPQMKSLLQQTLALSVTVIIATLVLTLLSLMYVAVTFTAGQENYALWVINAAGIPISLLIIPVIFLVYVYAIRNKPNRSCATCCHFKSSSQTELTRVCEQRNTNTSSNPSNIPSHTFFKVEHTGAFTDITESIFSSSEEDDPLVSTGNDSRLNSARYHAVY